VISKSCLAESNPFFWQKKIFFKEGATATFGLSLTKCNKHKIFNKIFSPALLQESGSFLGLFKRRKIYLFHLVRNEHSCELKSTKWGTTALGI